MERTSGLALTQKICLALLALALFEIVVALISDPVSAEMHEEWVVRYNGSAYSRDDYATSIAVDAASNVYVTGRSGQPHHCYGYATVKYDSRGRELWATGYNPNPCVHGAAAIAVDAAGNVYVTGSSDGPGMSSDYATIKYDTNGNELWVTRYDGPANSEDSAAAIAVDAAGNVYVTGSSDGPGTSSDYATIKYDTNGNELWVTRYDGPANSEDSAAAIAVDTAGYVYVTGNNGTAKYDGSSGNRLWHSLGSAAAIAVDTTGNVSVTGNNGTAKYNNNGSELWSTITNAVAIAVDAAGNAYVTGSSNGTSPADYTTIKYDPNGNELWLLPYNGPANSDDRPAAIALDGTGNVYVTGTSIGPDTREDYATIKISPDDIETGGEDNGNGGGCFISATFH
jgi:hypothetical protein